MPLASRCHHLETNQEITIARAIKLRAQARARRESDPTFLCVRCKRVVHAHKEGQGQKAHFEHAKRWKDCPLSDAYVKP